MRLNIFKDGGIMDSAIVTIQGMTMTAPLTLEAEITEVNQAITKQYVDNATEGLDASNINSGTVLAARLPGMTGDITVNTGNSNVVLNPSGVIAGTYTKVTVDGKGRVTSGTSLSENDIPNLSWNKITSDRPTTLAGYGITDGLTNTGGTVTGTLTLHANPTTNTQLATKEYTDSLMSGLRGGVETGDILLQATSVTPAGFLRCNGGIVSRTTFSALFGVIGNTFSNGDGIMPGSGQPWRRQYDINTEQSVNITGWTTTTSLPGVLGNSQAIVTRNRVFLLGGNTGSTSSIVYTAPINTDGTLGTWTTGASLPGVLSSSQAVVTRNRVYLLGGHTGAWSSIVYTAPINVDGTLGTWTTGTSLPGIFGRSQVVLTRTRIFLLGGNTGAWSSIVYTAPILGGLNDYSPYYDGTIVPIDSANQFTLPNFISVEASTPNMFYYIKT